MFELAIFVAGVVAGIVATIAVHLWVADPAPEPTIKKTPIPSRYQP